MQTNTIIEQLLYEHVFADYTHSLCGQSLYSPQKGMLDLHVHRRLAGQRRVDATSKMRAGGESCQWTGHTWR